MKTCLICQREIKAPEVYCKACREDVTAFSKTCATKEPQEPESERGPIGRKTKAIVTHLTYLECIDQIPPAYCRLIAREIKTGWRQKILTIPEIAQRAGLSWQKTAAIARRKSFARVPVEDADKFRKGCGITIQNEKLHVNFLKRNFNRKNSFEHYFKYSKAKWPYAWKSRFMNRILKRL